MAKKKKKKATSQVPYGEAVREIETILESIDRDEIDIDELSVKVQRAVDLIEVCRDKLRATEVQVNEVLAGLEEDEIEAAAGPAAAAPERSAATEPPQPETPTAASEDDAPAGGFLYEEQDDELPF